MPAAWPSRLLPVFGLLLLTVSGLICRSSAIQHSSTLHWAKTAVEPEQMPLCLVCFSAWLQQAHLRPVICGVKQLSKGPSVGLFSEQLVQNSECWSFHLHSEPKWEVKHPVGSSQFGSILLNIPQKPDSSVKSNNPRVVRRSQKRRLRGLEVWNLGEIVSPSRGKKKKPSIKKSHDSTPRLTLCLLTQHIWKHLGWLSAI